MSRSDVPDGLLEVGRIGKPHGVRGDLYVTFTSDVVARHEPGATLSVRAPRDSAANRSSGEDELIELTITTSRPVQDRFVVHFDGIDDRTAAERLVNKTLFAAPRDDDDDDDALWVHELIGARVVDTSGRQWGTCVSVIDNPAHAILEISNGALVPIPFVVGNVVVGNADGVVTIDPPLGLHPDDIDAG